MTATQPVRLLVGLGNPGNEYQQTRHNAGAQLVEQLARQHGSTLLADSKYHGLVGRLAVDGQPLRLLIPTTFMNHSGRAVAALANFYKIDSASILVAHDELDIAPGAARLKIGGGHGGHNGLRDIVQCLSNQNNFSRLRIGIGHPGDSKQVSHYVLSTAPSNEQKLIDDSINAALAVLPEIIRGNDQNAMNLLHRHGG